MNKFNKNKLMERKDVPIYTKFRERKTERSNLVNIERKKEYEYYKCDYCGEEIKILKQKNKMTGGTLQFSKIITKNRDLKVALCNKCLKPVLKILEEQK